MDQTFNKEISNRYGQIMLKDMEREDLLSEGRFYNDNATVLNDGAKAKARVTFQALKAFKEELDDLGMTVNEAFKLSMTQAALNNQGINIQM